jgi:hypothetical protein
MPSAALPALDQATCGEGVRAEHPVSQGTEGAPELWGHFMAFVLLCAGFRFGVFCLQGLLCCPGSICSTQVSLLLLCLQLRAGGYELSTLGGSFSWELCFSIPASPGSFAFRLHTLEL